VQNLQAQCNPFSPQWPSFPSVRAGGKDTPALSQLLGIYDVKFQEYFANLVASLAKGKLPPLTVRHNQHFLLFITPGFVSRALAGCYNWANLNLWAKSTAFWGQRRWTAAKLRESWR
jgi:hypothetical protein